MKKFDLYLLFNISLILVAFMLSACAPKTETKQFETPKNTFETDSRDPDLKKGQDEAQISDLNTVTTWDGEYTPAMILRVGENLAAIGLNTNYKNLVRTAIVLGHKMHSMEGARMWTPMKSAPYSELLVSRSREEIEATLTGVDMKLEKGTKRVIGVLNATVSNFHWPTGRQNLTTTGAVVASFMDQFVLDLNSVDIYEPLKTPLIEKIAGKKQWGLDLLNRVTAELYASDRLSGIVNLIQRVMKEEGFHISEDLQHRLDLGIDLATTLDDCNTSQSALTALVQVWGMLTPEERELYFKPANKDLYELFRDASPTKLRCFTRAECGNILRPLLRDLIVLPKIEKYGVGKICSLLNQKARDYSVELLENSVPELFQKLPEIVAESIEEGVMAERTKIIEIRDDFPDFIQKKLQEWANVKLPSEGKVSSVVTGTVGVQMRGTEILMNSHANGTTGAESVAATLSSQAFALKAGNLPEAYARQTAIDMLNLLIAITGYTDRDMNLIPAWLKPIKDSEAYLDVTNFTGRRNPFVMMDEFDLATAFKTTTPRESSVNTSAKAQAELLRSLSEVMEFLSDWKTTGYEKSLGSIMVKEILPEYDVKELRQPLFPKSDLFALSIAAVSAVLRNLTYELSQGFVANLDNGITWLNLFDSKSADTVVMAGVVDVKNGKRGNEIKSEDISRWIIALSEFLKLTEKIEQTQSKFLVTVDGTGKRPLDIFLDARKQVRFLILGMSNLLSSQMIDSDGLVVRSMELNNFKNKSKAPKIPLEQALAIRALLRAADAVGLDTYLQSAKEIYFEMNRSMFNEKTRFYNAQGSSKVLTIPQTAEILRALTELRPHLSTNSQQQLDWIGNPWYESLQNLH